MGEIFERTLATIMAVLMVLTSAPLIGFVGMEWDWLKIDLSEINIENLFAIKASAKAILFTVLSPFTNSYGQLY